MKIRFYFKKTNKDIKKQIRKYLLEKKVTRLIRLISPETSKITKLIIYTEHFIHHNAFLVKFNFKINKKELIAEEKSHNPLKALDLAFDRLINQIKKLESFNPL